MADVWTAPSSRILRNPIPEDVVGLLAQQEARIDEMRLARDHGHDGSSYSHQMRPVAAGSEDRRNAPRQRPWT
ncbi:hypothetical protein CLCR_09379 [Cladophialophora carrionii]|uniref:Uncharacterized protein n=1 Tax=Cladophialophora carrionii TaxID=86049 RepID=A0A1C1CRI5_9EURO|nr:hypothetical protein CLCR_09379 [Cladophialophora carrionii]